MKLTSKAFQEGARIPLEYTCDGANLCPPLEIQDVPEEAKSLVLIMDDPDVPDWVRKDRLYVHLVLYNIPRETRFIPEEGAVPGLFGKNTSGTLLYDGPCPPDREHRYFFKLYALDITLNIPLGPSKEAIEKAMEGHIIDKAELMGRYLRLTN